VRTAIVLFTRDLRVRDHPALASAAAAAERVVPLFVLDDAILGASSQALNRLGFLYESLADLRASLRSLGAPLVVRRGDVVAEVERIRRRTGAEALFLSADVSEYAQRREERLRRLRLEVHACPGVNVVDELKPYRVFTPYYRRWTEAPLRAPVRAPRLRAVPGLTLGAIPKPPPGRSPEVAEGGETAGRHRLETWLRSGLPRYDAERDLPASDAASRLSPYLHFGCLSPLGLVARLDGRPEAEGFIRQLAWRDFFAQLLLAEPASAREDLRPRGDRWNDDPEGLQAWRDGRTGYPLVDAGMRQLSREGWMHNRARLVAASFLTKHLYVDWRLGAAHFSELLIDGDLASNTGNWQWVAGTGADTRPNRVFNPTLQAKRYDPDGDYVRRYVPEAGTPDYLPPLVDHAEAVARFRRSRARR
jgi:deoxyribodipyrimidine photo-lyase